MGDKNVSKRMDLGDGLVMRAATPLDRDALTEFNRQVFGESIGGLDEQAAAWTRDLFRGDHPTSPISDHSIVEDTTTGQIVSSCLLISQTWSYGGVPFAFGRPELVATHPDYRGRGLIGRQFNRLHQVSAERGQLVQGLTGIPNFYRRFGYEPALQVAAVKSGPASAFALLQDEEQEQFRFRQADENDVALICKFYEQSTRRSMLAAIRDEALWRYELSRERGSDYIHDIVVIESESGNPVGVLAHLNQIQRGTLSTTLVEIREDIGWENAAEPILRFLRARAEAIGRPSGESYPSLGFELVSDHPLLRLADSRLPTTGRPFAWYVRVPNVVAFLQAIAPVFERRLASSFLAGYSGVFEMSLFQTGYKIKFDRGRIATIEPWLPASIFRTDAAIPQNAFLYLLFGARTLTEVESAYPDCRIKTDLGRVMVETLFPRRHSVIWPIG
jgi:predicted N-acetyltransferase YhbS